MYFKKLLPASIAGAALLASAGAFADIDITVNSASGSVGSTVVITYDYSALDADDVGGFQFDITYDPSSLTPTDVSQCGNNAPATHNASCTEPGGAGNGTVRTLIADFTPPTDEISPFNIAPFGQFTFQIDQPGTHTLTFTNPVGSDTAGGNVNMTGNNATITGSITGAAGYSSTPASGATIDLGPTPVGTTIGGIGAVTVSEIGDEQLDVTAFPSSNGDIVVTTAPFSIADGGASVGVDIECTPSSRGNITGNVEFTNNSVNQPAANYDVQCQGESPNVAVSTTTINLTGVIGGTNPSGSFDITNADDGFTNAATNAALADGGASTPDITITDGLNDATIQVDETDSVTVECDASTSGMSSENITLTFDDPNEAGGTGTRTVTVNCDIANAVPSFAGTPASPGPLNFGTVTNGTTSAPIGIDVANDGVGPSPASDLLLSSVTVSDPQFAAVINDPGPFQVGDPATADAVEVTCTPDAGTTGSFTGTLTINHNGDDDPTTYNLECAGQTDATFSSTPPDGGNLNLGIVPPVTMTPPGDITFSNGGSADSYDVDCTVTDPDGVFTFSPDPISFTVAPGGSQSATFQCTPAAPQIYQADVACTITGADQASASYTVTCAGQPLVVPTMNRWGLILMALVLLALGGFAGRRMMA